MALICGASEDGETLGVLRKRGNRVEAAIMQKAIEGRPIYGELVALKPRPEPLLFDVETVYSPPPAARRQALPPVAERASAGPVQVASDRYRRGWDRLFKRRRSTEVN